MAEKTQIYDLETYTIYSPDGRTQASFVPERGGSGYSIIMPFGNRDRELLYSESFFEEKADDEFPNGWPFLFPICGRLEHMGIEGNYLHDENIYHLPIHGFSWSMPWQVVYSDNPDSLILELTDNEDTHKMYPFSFKVQLIYKVSDCKLTCEQIYTNTDNKPMVYYAGFHPYFLTPHLGAGKEKVMLDFKPKRFFHYNDRLTGLIGEKKPFNLPISIVDHRINEQLTEVIEDNIATLQYPDGFNIHMKTSNIFRYLQKYTIYKKPFICIEPWMGFPNALNTAKGSRWLMPGNSEVGYLELFCETKN